MTEDGRSSGEKETQSDEDREAPRDEKGGGRRDDEHRDDDDGADGFKSGDRSDGDHGHEKVVDELGVKALRLGEAGIEGGESEFLVEEGDDKEVQEEGGSDDESGVGDLDEVVACFN